LNGVFVNHYISRNIAKGPSINDVPQNREKLTPPLKGVGR